MEKQNRESHCVQGSGIFLVGAGDRRQPYLSPVRCSSGMFSALNEKTGTGGIGTTIFYVVGGGLMVAAAILLITKKRMENR